jgi:hypothetical protein
MIDIETSWPKIRENAIKALKTGMVWHSLVQEARYRITEVYFNKIIIQRLEGGDDQVLTEAKATKAVADFNELGCRVRRRQLISPTVAEETAFVLFHPELSWDDDNEYIIQINQ